MPSGKSPLPSPSLSLFVQDFYWLTGIRCWIRKEQGNTAMDTNRENAASLARAAAFHLVSGGECPQGIPREFLKAVERNRRRYKAKLLASARSLLAETDSRPETELPILYGYTFRDGGCSWGRIVAVYAFAAVLGKECPSARDKVAETTGSFAAERLSHWIGQQGGWVQFQTRSKTAGRGGQLTRFLFLAACLAGIFARIGGMFFS